MKKLRSRIILVLFTLSSVLSSQYLVAKEQKIAVVDIKSIIQLLGVQNSVEAEFKDEIDALKLDAARLQKELTSFQNKPIEATNEHLSKYTELNNWKKKLGAQQTLLSQQINVRLQEEHKKAITLMNKAIKREGKKGRYTAILYQDRVAYGEVEFIDISLQVAERVKKGQE